MAEENKIEIVINARDETQQTLTSVEKNLQRVADNFTRVGKQMMMIGGVGTAAIFGIVKSTVDFGGSMDKMRKTTGMTGAEIIKLRYAAEQEHASFEGLATGARILSRNMYEAQRGSKEAADLFARMGIEITNTDGTLRSAGDVILDIAEFMKNNTDETMNSALAMKLLGRSGTELVPFLRMGRDEIARLGEEGYKLRGMTEEEISQLKLFGDETYKLKEAVAGVKDQIAVGLLPVILDWLEKGNAIARWFRELDPDLKNFIAKAVLIGSVMLVGGGALLFFTGQLAQIGVFAISAIKYLTALGISGTASIGALVTSMLTFVAVLVSAITLMQAYAELRGFIEAKKEKRTAENRLKEQEALEKEWKGGKLTREEMLARMHEIEAGGAEQSARLGTATWGTSPLERVGMEIGRFQQVYADIRVTKEEDIGKKITTALKPVMAGQ